MKAMNARPRIALLLAVLLTPALASDLGLSGIGRIKWVYAR